MTPEEILKKRQILEEEKDKPVVSWWLSFADPKKPKGEQFLGVAIVKAPGFVHAIEKAGSLNINPGGEVRGYLVDNVPDSLHDRLLSRKDLQEVNL